jgi:TFIIF-interacting CTD phosphatase-like protein
MREMDNKGGNYFSRLTVVLDLNETLIHSTILQIYNIDFHTLPEEQQLLLLQQQAHHHQQQNTINHTNDFFDLTFQDIQLRIHKRPGLDSFLTWASQRFDLICFTASKSEYADAILNVLDPSGTIFKQRFSRNHCIASTMFSGAPAKDLTILNRPLERTIFIDDSIYSIVETQLFNHSMFFLTLNYGFLN